MFYNNSSFNQPLGNWDVSSVTNCVNFSTGASAWSLSKPNFTNCNPD